MKYQKRYIPNEEFEILYCASNHRIRTIISILRYTGLRSIEVLRLKQTDVCHLTKTIHVRVAKKKKTVYVKKWLPPRVFKQLKRYLYGNNLNDTPWLFPAFYNRSKHYPQDALYSYLIRACQRNFIHPEIRPHSLRHTFALDIYRRSNHDIHLTAKALNHTGLSSVCAYIDIDRETEIKQLIKTMS